MSRQVVGTVQLPACAGCRMLVVSGPSVQLEWDVDGGHSTANARSLVPPLLEVRE